MSILEVGNANASLLRHITECAEVVIDDHLTTHADNSAIGGERDLLFVFAHRPVGKFSVLVYELRHGEVTGSREAMRAEVVKRPLRRNDPVRRLRAFVGRQKVFVKRIGEQQREIAGRVERQLYDLSRIRLPMWDATLPGPAQALGRHLDERSMAILRGVLRSGAAAFSVTENGSEFGSNSGRRLKMFLQGVGEAGVTPEPKTAAYLESTAQLLRLLRGSC